MTILVLPMNFNNVVKDLMRDLKDMLSIVYPLIEYDRCSIKIKPDIEILFRPATLEHCRGRRPDYYWTNSYGVEEYFKHVNNSKELKTFRDLVHVVLEDCINKMEEKNDDN